MRLVDLSIRRPVTTTMFVLFLVVLGLISYGRLAVDVFPNVDIPVVTVSTALPGASVEEMESSVTKVIEEAINTIEGIDELRSETHEGLSRVLAFFVLERDGDAAAQDVRDKVSGVLSRLPQEVSAPIIDKFDVEAVPVMTIAVSGRRDLREITEIARVSIKEDIETLPGVGSVTLLGGLERAVQIEIDTDRMLAYGVTVQQVRAALGAQNLEIPGGHVDQGARELTLRTMGRVERVRDFADLIIASRDDHPLTIGDIARVEDSVIEPRNRTRLDGRPAVSLVLRKQSGTNTVEVIRGVKERLAELRATLPADIDFEVVRDHSRFIEQSFRELRFHLILAGILVSLTVMLFIANLRATLIAAVAIPTSIIATFSFMDALGFTLNNLTMLALVLATGIVIDDAVVVLENVFRHMEEKGESAWSAAGRATREISLAVMATTFSLVVIFLPVAFMEGIVGRFFNSYGLTIAISILLSLLISFTLTPMLCSRFLRVSAGSRSRERGAYAAVQRGYGAILRWSLVHRWAIVLLSVLTVASVPVLVSAVGMNWVPEDDQSEFEVVIQTPEGFTLERTDAVFRDIESALRDLPEVRHLLTTIGDSTGRLRAGQGPVTIGSIYVGLAPLGSRERAQTAVMKDARAILERHPDLRASVQPVSVFSSGQRRTDIEVNLTGPELDRLHAYSQALMRQMRARPGFVDVDTTLSVRQPELRVRISREKASDFGLQVRDVAATLRTLVGGEPVGTFRENQEQYDVWLRAAPSDRDGARAIESLPVASAGGRIVTLGNLATLHEERGPAQIDHYNRRRKVTIVANLDGPALSEAKQQILDMVDRLELPATYRAEMVGQAKTLAETGRNLLLAFVLSLVFMYMILAAQFESFVHPITILLALPLSIPFALASLWMLGEPLNLYSFLGLFMLFGIVKKNGILQVDYTNTLRTGGMPRDDAILEANHVRLRPILMTTVMLIAGMIPIALGEGPGSASRASMAKVIIGGQALCLLLTLLVTPVAYSLFDDLGTRLWARRRRPSGAQGRQGLQGQES